MFSRLFAHEYACGGRFERDKDLALLHNGVVEYTYLLSPAQTWADFGALDIVVNTPYYMTQSGPEGFQYNNPGYELHLPGLPEDELTFTLCAEKKPKVRSRFEYLYPLAIYIGVIIAITVGVAIVFSRGDKKEE